MTLRGERFTLDLSDDEDGDVGDSPSFTHGFAADIKERVSPASPVPPTAPRLASTTTGFPEHRKRTGKSAFKRRREDASRGAAEPAPSTRSDKETIEQDEKRSIDDENKRRLAAMSSAEIGKERAELMSSLPPSLLERFLRKANIDDEDQMDMNTDGDRNPSTHDTSKKDSTKPAKSVKFDVPTSKPEPAAETEDQETEDQDQEKSFQPNNPLPTDDRPPAQPPADLFPASQPPTGPVHFPRPPPRDSPMPNLDPSSPSFLTDLQTHYFPETPHDPSSLSWLDPSTDDTPPTSAYHPESTADALGPADIRFSLTGNILAPRTSLSLPTSLGLHHHGSDPDAAGYTIPELAIFSRSSLPAQRCLAWQVLGRLLYRLGKGGFGQRGSSLVEGLWGVVEREGVVGRMLAEVNGEKKEKTAADPNVGAVGRHASASAWATEAIWLWRQGGGGDRGILKDGAVRST